MSKKEELQLEKIRHSLSHLMSMAIIKMYPDAGLGVGPSIENGFYQDYGLLKPISSELLPKIEKEIKKMIQQNIKFEQHDMSFDKALKLYKKDPYKSEMIKDLKKAGEKKLSFYKSNWFENLCNGPHVASTKEINPDAFKLTKIAGAYWKGDEKNKMLQRIYGVAFKTKKDLDEYLARQAKAEKRDHRKLGKELDLFSFHNEGHGFAFWHPKGMILRNALMKPYDQIHKEAGYQIISTPILLSEELWHKSGHWDNYKDHMYFTKIDKKVYAIKPMNCPGCIIIYNTHPHSYKELPVKLSEMGEVHRHEPSGTLHGLFRARAFRQDDSHIFAKEDQVEEEIKKVVVLTLDVYKIFNFPDIDIEISTRPKKSIGSKAIWDKSEKIMKKVLKNLKLDYKINHGDGAFYGPKIDFHIKDSIGRSWQCGTTQLDFSMPERFDLKYTDKDGSFKRPAMIHRTILGSIQRFVGILIEHYTGAFPVWLAPVQVQIIPVGQKFNKYGEKIKEELLEKNIRIELNNDNETLGKKIREGELQKVPYLLIVGDKEMKSDSVAVRNRKKGDLGPMKTKEFIAKIKEEIEKRK